MLPNAHFIPPKTKDWCTESIYMYMEYGLQDEVSLILPGLFVVERDVPNLDTILTSIPPEVILGKQILLENPLMKQTKKSYVLIT